jgi:DNA-binding beta-propeller fold protein YncE
MKRFTTGLWFLGLSVLLLGGTVAGSEPANAPLVLVRSIRLPGVQGRFDHFAADVKGERLFVAALGNDTLEVLDLKRGTLAQSVRGMHEPQGVAFAPDLGRLFVGNGEGRTCDILDATTLARVSKVDGLDDADNVRYDAAARRVYVGYGRGALCVVDAASGRRVGEVRLSDHPESFQLERSGSRIFVNVPGAGHIAVVDRLKGAVVAKWSVAGAGANFPMALDETHHRLFVGCRSPARLLVYDTQTSQQVASAAIVGDTDDLFYDAARKRLYVAGGEGFITVLQQQDADHYTTVARLPTAAGARTGLFVPERDQFFLAVPHRGSQQAEVRVYRCEPPGPRAQGAGPPPPNGFLASTPDRRSGTGREGSYRSDG